MTWGRASSAVRRAAVALAGLAFGQTSSSRAGPASSGPVTPTSTQARRDDALRLSRIEVQAAELARMKPSDPRRGPLRKAIYSARHEILKRGPSHA